MRLGILETIGLAGTLVFAIPAALLGIEFVVSGSRPFIGWVLIVVAVLMVVVPRYVVSPSDVPERLAGEAVDRALGDDEDRK